MRTGSFLKRSVMGNNKGFIASIDVGTTNCKTIVYNIRIKINFIKAKKDFSTQDPLFKEVVESHIILKGVEDFIDKIWLQ